MQKKKVIAALKRLKVQTGSLACCGCGREHNCGIHGCAIIRHAEAAIEQAISPEDFAAAAKERDEANRRVRELEAEVERLNRENFEQSMLIADHEWIDAQFKVPDHRDSDWVIGVASGKAGNVRYENAIEMVGYDCIEKKWFLSSRPMIDIDVSHWMPLPAMPKKEA